MTLKISRSQVYTQPNPTQPNPWMDPTHDQLCSTFIKWTGWTLAMALPWWQHHKHCRAYYYYYYFFANMGLDVVSCQKIKKWFVLASSDGFVYDGCTSLSLSLSLSQTAASHVDQCLLQPTCAVIYWFTSQQVTWGRRVYPYLRVYPYPTRECKYQSI